MAIRELLIRITRLVAVNTLIAMAPVVMYLVINPKPRAAVTLEIAIYSTVYSNVIGILLTFALPVLLPRILPLPVLQRWIWFLLGLLAAATAGTLAASGLLWAAGVIPSGYYLSVTWSSLKIAAFITVTLGVGSMIFQELRGKLEATTLALRTKELERERAEKLASEARLQSLESRIHPHFLFNALNSVASLIRDDPDGAERQIERISRFLRFAIDQGVQRLVPVEHEMKIVSDYLAIEETRFGGRLRYKIDVSPSVAQAAVPPMSVQSLVENSLKHSIAPRRGGGEVRVVAVSANDSVHIRVWDDGPGFSPESRAPGHGLDILEGRLTAQFGVAAKLKFENGNGMSVEMELPCVRI